ncbi:hypothetical protein IFM89_039899 [Coptis chinensis]|uniref:FKB95-like N-terminal Kelch domain-containing protein n=1 Tax=Coptis chinensis TaxID=261450 RepID=A0A835GTA5_9MAGN|nr:hypothetical protein IFM89_039899 [Coptis chinensis]
MVHPLRCSLFGYSTYPKPDNQEKSLYISFFAEAGVVWYVINPGEFTNNKEITTLDPTFTIAYSVVGEGSCSVALGSTIYMMFCDEMEGSTNVVTFETRKRSGGDDPFICRKLNSHTLGERTKPTLVSTHGKMYVFGSSVSSPKPWAEVFDPDLNLWSPLPDPPKKVCESSYGYCCISVVVVGDKIYVCMYSVMSVFSFDVKTKVWEQVTTPLSDAFHWSFGGTVLDDILFMYSLGSVMAYDLTNEIWFEKPVKGLGIKSTSELPLRELRYGHIVAIGNKTLCVVWEDNVDSRACVHCVKFRIERAVNSKRQSFLRADVQGRSTYHITAGCLFSDCLAL